MGAQGAAFVQDVSDSFSASSLRFLHVLRKDRCDAVLKYEATVAPDPSSTLAERVAIFNARGQQGWAFQQAESLGLGSLISDEHYVWVQDAKRPGKYLYTIEPKPSTTADWVRQANRQGSQGYGLSRFDGEADGHTVYMKAEGAGFTYTYSVEEVPSDIRELTALLTRKGRDKAVPVGKQFFANPAGLLGREYRMVFEKNSAQTAALEYQVVTLSGNETLEQLRDQFNQKAAQGYLFLYMDKTITGGTFFSVYVKGLTVPSYYRLEDGFGYMSHPR